MKRASSRTEISSAFSSSRRLFRPTIASLTNVPLLDKSSMMAVQRPFLFSLNIMQCRFEIVGSSNFRSTNLFVSDYPLFVIFSRSRTLTAFDMSANQVSTCRSSFNHLCPLIVLLLFSGVAVALASSSVSRWLSEVIFCDSTSSSVPQDQSLPEYSIYGYEVAPDPFAFLIIDLVRKRILR